jgi:hypothetical protein
VKLSPVATAGGGAALLFRSNSSLANWANTNASAKSVKASRVRSASKPTDDSRLVTVPFRSERFGEMGRRSTVVISAPKSVMSLGSRLRHPVVGATPRELSMT